MAPADSPPDARRELFAGLIDHAPTFPPARLPLADGLAEHRRVRESDVGWLVKRFVCPRSKLAELGDEPLRLSVVVDDGRLPTEDARIEAVEAAGLDPEVLVDAATEVYCELPLRGETWFRLLRLAELGLRAKVRCGGSALPSISALGRFVQECRRQRIPFKATAGLHHPVRANGEHGFLNLLAAAVFDGEEEQALGEEDESAFGVTAEAFTWRDRSSGPEEIAAVRQELFVGFGSCSAQEPIDGLKTLRMLPG